MSNEPTLVANSSSWVKNVPQANLEFEIEIEKRALPSKHRQNQPNTTTVRIDGIKQSANGAKISSSNNGRVSIENISLGPNEITIKSDFAPTKETAATRMSSGYFSGDEFRSYYINSATNYYDFGVNSQSPTLSSSTMDTATNNNNNNNNNTNNQHQFNIGKFLSNSSANKHKLKSDEAIEDLNRLYKSIGFAEEDDVENELNNNRDGLVNENNNNMLNDQQRFTSSFSRVLIGDSGKER
jgi:hypothetical protein